MKKNRIHYIIIAALVLFIIILIVNFYYRSDQNVNTGISNSTSTTTVESFTDCQSAGYPTTSTYPKQCTVPDGSIFIEDLKPDSSVTSYKDAVKVYNLKAGDTVKSPFELTGEVRGQWTFEANLPIKVIARSGEVLVATSTMVSNWMTSDYVSFQKTLIFNIGTSTEGFIVIEKDNPSGLPQYADAFKIPVRFEK